MSRLRALFVITVLAAAVAACGNGNPADTGNPAGTGSPAAGGGAAAAAPVTGGKADVTIDEVSGSSAGFQFQPQTATAKVGQVVAWVNKSEAPHNVTFDDASMPFGAQNPNDTYQLKFSAAGKFKYLCNIHPGMDAELDVS